MPVNFVSPGMGTSPSGFFYGGSAIGANGITPSTPTYHSSANAYFSVGNALRQGTNDSTFTQAGVAGWLDDVIESDGYNIQAQLQTMLSDGVLTESELLLLQFDMDQYQLEVQMTTNVLAVMKQAMSSIVTNIR